MRRPHDLGGLPGGPVAPTEHDFEPWEKQVDALLVLLGEKSLVRTDELRRIEAITATLLQRGVLTADEIGRRMAEIEARDA